MNKKGFTLIEVLAVVIILTLLMLLVVPNVVNKFSTKKNEVKQVNDELIISAAKLYVDDHSDEFIKENDMQYCVSIQKLVDEDYLNSKVIDITTNKNVVSSYSVQINYSDGFTYSVVNSEECN